MKKIYSIEKTIEKNIVFFDKNIYDSGLYDDQETSDGILTYLKNYTIPIPNNIDIFDIIHDKRVMSKPRIFKFLLKLRYSIYQRINEISDLCFNKLSIEISERPHELMIDWLYNYFRVFYSFNDIEGDMYGLILNNTMKFEFTSEFKPLIESNYNEIAEKTLDFVIKNIQG